MTHIIKPLAKSYIVLPVLQFLNGRKLDDMAGSCISGLRPSNVRIVDDLKPSEDPFKLNRVTIYTTEGRDFILGIEQEVEVLLPEYIKNGGELLEAANIPETVDWELVQQTKEELKSSEILDG